MTMPQPLSSEVDYVALVERIMPDLQIDKIESNTDGLANHILLVNDALVFRFARGDFGRISLARERKVLPFLKDSLPVPVPEILYASEDVLVYPFIPGESFTRNCLASLSPPEYLQAGSQLGGFLHAMHSIRDPALPHTAAPVSLDAFQKQRHSASERLYSLLLPHQVAWIEQVYAFLDQPGAFEFQPALIHGDLAPYHILFEPISRRLRGVIDFGVSGLGDPASDLGALLGYYGPDFIHLLGGEYPQMEKLLPRARFYAQAIEVQWVLLGLERGENFWFTAHLGGWRGLDSALESSTAE